MSERKYSVSELEALRGVIENKYLYGSYSPNFKTGGMSRSFHEAEKTAVVEQQVRTHMLAGHTAEDLIADGGRWAIASTVLSRKHAD